MQHISSIADIVYPNPFLLLISVTSWSEQLLERGFLRSGDGWCVQRCDYDIGRKLQLVVEHAAALKTLCKQSRLSRMANGIFCEFLAKFKYHCDSRVLLQLEIWSCKHDISGPYPHCLVFSSFLCRRARLQSLIVDEFRFYNIKNQSSVLWNGEFFRKCDETAAQHVVCTLHKHKGCRKSSGHHEVESGKAGTLLTPHTNFCLRELLGVQDVALTYCRLQIDVHMQPKYKIHLPCILKSCQSELATLWSCSQRIISTSLSCTTNLFQIFHHTLIFIHVFSKWSSNLW